MSITAILVGAAFAGVLLWISSFVGLHRDRGFYTALIIAIAFLYPVFAWERFDLEGTVIQLVIAGTFTVLALGAYKSASGAMLGFTLLAHATFDLAASAIGMHAPLLWAELCLGFDVVLALAARIFVR